MSENKVKKSITIKKIDRLNKINQYMLVCLCL